MDFQRQPGFQEHARWVVIRVVWGAQSTIQLATYRIKDTGYRIQDTETQRHRDTETQRHRHTEKQRHRIQDQADASQPGGPSIEGAGGYIVCMLTYYFYSFAFA